METESPRLAPREVEHKRSCSAARRLRVDDAARAARLDRSRARGARREGAPPRARAIAAPQGAEVEVDGRRLVNLCSNDYLGLAADPRLRRAAADAAEREGAGAAPPGSSPAISLSTARSSAPSRRSSRAEAALLFNTGYHANVGVPPALVGRDDAVFCDVLNHASIVDGCLLSRAALVRYRHLDVRARRLLARTQARRKLVVTDSIFWMDGDAAPLREIAELANGTARCSTWTRRTRRACSARGRGPRRGPRGRRPRGRPHGDAREGARCRPAPRGGRAPPRRPARLARAHLHLLTTAPPPPRRRGARRARVSRRAGAAGAVSRSPRA